MEWKTIVDVVADHGQNEQHRAIPTWSFVDKVCARGLN